MVTVGEVKLPELMLTYNRLENLEHIYVKFESKYNAYVVLS